jgi:hypothetical protein
MSWFNTTLIIIAINLIIGCSPIYNVSYDYDRNVEFRTLRTYGWLPVPEKATVNNLDLNRIKKAVDNEMKARGLRISSDNPNFFVAGHLVKKDKVNVTNWGYGFSPYGRYWGRGGFSVYQYEEGTLIIDLVDANSKNLVWRGVAKADVEVATTPEKRDKLINGAVQKILNNFPPPVVK